MLARIFLPLALAGILAGCNTTAPPKQLSAVQLSDMNDTHSFAQADSARSTHVHLNLALDFKTRTLSGFAEHTIAPNGAKFISFDYRQLQLDSVQVDGQTVQHEMAPGNANGAHLRVPIQSESKTVRIYYRTTPDAEAIMWLDSTQTAGKRMPFMFTQGQAILTRTWIPLQDSPGVRITYTAEMQVPKDALCVMSATNPTARDSSGRYTFEMNQPVPPYLIALACGDLEFAPVGNRTGVYAEPVTVKAAAWEFAEMEAMLETTEKLYGPYRWERYDVLVLPPSFPFGGMENPRLTFATPTIIAGDRSLTNLIAHELAHSWSGNLVTNATWNDFWLNEGFTVYLEKRIMEAINGRDYADMTGVLDRQDLEETLTRLGQDSRDSHLFLNLEGRNPDDGMTDVAYEKGYAFLRALEEAVGRDKFDAFLRKYFDEHAFKSLTTKQFERYLEENLLRPEGVTFNTDEWIHGPGLPENVVVPTSARLAACDVAIEQFNATAKVPGSELAGKWSTHEWLYFIRGIKRTTDPAGLRALDRRYKISQTGNSEIAAAWFELAFYAGYKPAYPYAEDFLQQVGRRKFLVPLYEAMVKGKPGVDEARRVYQSAREGYHAVSINTLNDMLGVTGA